MRSRQGSRCHVATSPRRDVTKSRHGGQLIQKSTIPPRRDVTTSRRQLKNLHLIIKCEGARDSRASKNVRPERRIWRTCNTDFENIFGFLYWFFLFVLIIVGSHEDILDIAYFVSFLHVVLSLFLGLHQTLLQTMD